MKKAAIAFFALVAFSNAISAEFTSNNRDIPDLDDHVFHGGAIFPPPFSWWYPEPLTSDYLLTQLAVACSHSYLAPVDSLSYFSSPRNK
jgi:hypothetical protein